MAMFKVRKQIVVSGGSVLLGADVNIYRSAANMLKTDDSLTIGGSKFVSAYGTSTPTMDTNGQVQLYAKANTNYIVFRLGGTNIIGALPSVAANGSVSWTVGTAAPP